MSLNDTLMTVGLLGVAAATTSLNTNHSIGRVGIRPTELSGPAAAIEQLQIPLSSLGTPVTNFGQVSFPISQVSSPFSISVLVTPDGRPFDTVLIGDCALHLSHSQFARPAIEASLMHPSQKPLLLVQDPHQSSQALLVTGPDKLQQFYDGQKITNFYLYHLTTEGAIRESVAIHGFVDSPSIPFSEKEGYASVNLARLNFTNSNDQSVHSISFALEPKDCAYPVTWQTEKSTGSAEKSSDYGPDHRILNPLGDICELREMQGIRVTEWPSDSPKREIAMNRSAK